MLLFSVKNALHLCIINGVTKMRYKKLSIGLIFIFFLAVTVATSFNKAYPNKIRTELKINPAIFEAYI